MILTFLAHYGCIVGMSAASKHTHTIAHAVKDGCFIAVAYEVVEYDGTGPHAKPATGVSNSTCTERYRNPGTKNDVSTDFWEHVFSFFHMHSLYELS